MRVPSNFLTKVLPSQIKNAIKYYESNNDITQKNSLSLFLEVYEEYVKSDEVKKNLNRAV